MSYINETDFVIENKELVYPAILTDGLQLYYDAKGKRDTDYHRDTMLDMSGNENHGKLHNFAYEKHSGYKDGLVFDYIDDKLVRPELNLKPDDFTFMLNGNIISFSPDGTVKRVQDGEVIESKGFNLITNGNFSDGLTGWSSLYGSGATVGQEYIYSVTSLANSASRLETTNNVPNPIGGHKYYVSGEIYPTRDSIHTRLNYNDTISFYPEANKWSKLAGILAPSKSSTEPFRFYHANTSYEIGDTWRYRNIQLIDLTATFGAGNEPTKEQMDEIVNRFGFIPNSQDLIDCIEYKGNVLGDMENIIDGLYKTEVLSGEEIYTDKADDAVVHVEVDGKSYQHAGTGKNLLGKTYQTVSATNAAHGYGGKNYSEIENGYRITNRWTSFGWKIMLKPSVKYTISGKLTMSNTENKNEQLYVQVNNHRGSDVNGATFLVANTDRRFSFTFTSRQDDVEDVIAFAANASGNIPTTLFDITDIQLEEGSVATSYEPPAPTPDYPIEIHSLNDFDVVSDVGRNYARGTSDEFKTVITGRYSGSLDAVGVISKFLYTLDELNVRAGDYITASMYVGEGTNGQSGRMRIDNQTGQNKHGNNVRAKNGYVIETFQVSPQDTELRFYLGSMDNNGDSIPVKEFKIEHGKKRTPWTPAPEEITEDDNYPLIDKINLLLDEPLRSVGDVKDRLFRDSDGMWKVERNVGELVADGSEDWEITVPRWQGTNDTMTFHITLGRGYPWRSFPREELTSNLFVSFPNIYGGIQASDLDFELVTADNTLGDKRFRVLKSRLKTQDLNGWREFLAEKSSEGNPLKLLYVVSIPTIEILDQELQDKLNNLRSFQDSNYVYTVLPNENNILSENLKPTLHAKFLYNNWYKEDRVINNLMIYNRALSNEEMLQNYKTIKRRWKM